MYDNIPYNKRMTARERFWAKVEKTEECWLWKASIDKTTGYGDFSYFDKSIKAHRFAYMLEYGKIPSGLFVCHKCDVKICVRPDHLFLGTHTDNMQDMVVKGRSPHTSTEHPEFMVRGEKHHNSKLTKEKVLQIRALSANYNQYQLADMFGVHQATINNVLLNKTWKHV